MATVLLGIRLWCVRYYSIEDIASWHGLIQALQLLTITPHSLTTLLQFSCMSELGIEKARITAEVRRKVYSRLEGPITRYIMSARLNYGILSLIHHVQSASIPILRSSDPYERRLSR